jgi:lipid-binding SYLF domain-containing protein
MTLRRMSFVVLAGTLCLQAKDSKDDIAKRLDATTATFTEMAGAPDKGLPGSVLKKSACVVVVPGLNKGGFLVAAQYGAGFASCRTPKGWSAPLAMKMEGGSFGLQAGGESSDVILLVMNESGMKRLTSSKFTLGGEASVAAGPVGRDAQAMTDATMKAEILSYSRSQGVFGGISLNGSTLRPDGGANKALYGKEVESLDVLGGKVPGPAAAKPFVAKIRQFASEVAAKAAAKDAAKATKAAPKK